MKVTIEVVHVPHIIEEQGIQVTLSEDEEYLWAEYYIGEKKQKYCMTKDSLHPRVKHPVWEAMIRQTVQHDLKSNLV